MANAWTFMHLIGESEFVFVQFMVALLSPHAKMVNNCHLSNDNRAQFLISIRFYSSSMLNWGGINIEQPNNTKESCSVCSEPTTVHYIIPL
jgi:hypothetical protein